MAEETDHPRKVHCWNRLWNKIFHRKSKSSSEKEEATAGTATVADNGGLEKSDQVAGNEPSAAGAVPAPSPTMGEEAAASDKENITEPEPKSKVVSLGEHERPLSIFIQKGMEDGAEDEHDFESDVAGTPVPSADVPVETAVPTEAQKLEALTLDEDVPEQMEDESVDVSEAKHDMGLASTPEVEVVDAEPIQSAIEEGLAPQIMEASPEAVEHIPEPSFAEALNAPESTTAPMITHVMDVTEEGELSQQQENEDHYNEPVTVQDHHSAMATGEEHHDDVAANEEYRNQTEASGEQDKPVGSTTMHEEMLSHEEVEPHKETLPDQPHIEEPHLEEHPETDKEETLGEILEEGPPPEVISAESHREEGENTLEEEPIEVAPIVEEEHPVAPEEMAHKPKISEEPTAASAATETPIQTETEHHMTEPHAEELALKDDDNEEATQSGEAPICSKPSTPEATGEATGESTMVHDQNQGHEQSPPQGNQEETAKEKRHRTFIQNIFKKKPKKDRPATHGGTPPPPEPQPQ